MLDIEDEARAPVAEDMPVSQPYIPPVAAEHNPAPRMPRVEDFPPIAQREIQAKQQTANVAQPQQAVAQQRPQQPAPAPSYEEHVEDDRRPMGLLRRLASGLGRHHEEDQEHDMAAAPVARPAPQMQPAQQAAPRAPQQRPAAHGAAGQLDNTGRATPKPVTATEDEQLEIPAFLRRQAN
jgi:cell division protein FtsZ